jgi:hypothetical protein
VYYLHVHDLGFAMVFMVGAERRCRVGPCLSTENLGVSHHIAKFKKTVFRVVQTGIMYMKTSHTFEGLKKTLLIHICKKLYHTILYDIFIVSYNIFKKESL